ncbi:uncharacterized protein MAM_05633 [Metarhizium album ARSEF 1941]|uniref:Uncharacterized protein n=1 Tax=Metarhizium album (strain ARSEF 1941) TaxID=1081103 RepID=A0A0B2WRT9_METAS|nr:uncharacterized protein MAM_05633 [Metarhizium album ARSEF 1941]KHN96344.1 hypothetical protein MAM_05633 [Metarhizium album ARSEF 1941]
MCEHCFFVAAARLLGTSAQDMSRRTGIPVPEPKRLGEPGVHGVLYRDMIHAFDKLGLRFRLWQRGSAHRGVVEPPALPPSASPRVVGVAYQRPVGGHAVVATNPGTPYRRYMDCQAPVHRRDVTAAVGDSRVTAMFYVDKKASTGEMFNNQPQAVERMEVEEADAHLPNVDEPVEVVRDDELNKPSRREFDGLNCPALLATLPGTARNLEAKRSAEDGNLLRTRADGECEKARTLAKRLKERDEPTTPVDAEGARSPEGEGEPTPKQVQKAQSRECPKDALVQAARALDAGTASRQRKHLLDITKELARGTAFDLSKLAKAVNDEFIAHVNDDNLIKNYPDPSPWAASASAAVSVPMSSLPDDRYSMARAEMREVGKHLARSPPPLPRATCRLHPRQVVRRCKDERQDEVYRRNPWPVAPTAPLGDERTRAGRLRILWR